jgi:hypothetical protein
VAYASAFAVPLSFPWRALADHDPVVFSVNLYLRRFFAARVAVFVFPAVWT